MDQKEDELRDELKAILASSRELPAEHDDALADLFLEQLRSRQMSSCSHPAARGGAANKDRLVPVAITVGTGTVLSLVGALMGGATVGEFLLLWIFTTLVMAAVVQIGLIIANAQRKTDLGK